MATWGPHLRALFLGLGLLFFLAPQPSQAGTKTKLTKKSGKTKAGGAGAKKGAPAASTPEPEATDSKESEDASAPAASTPASSGSAPAAAAPPPAEAPPPSRPSDAPRAASGSSVAVLELRAVDPDLPASVVPAIDKALRPQLDANLSVLPSGEVADLRAGAEKAPDVSAVNATLAEAKKELLNFQNAAVIKKLIQAKRQLDPMLLQLRDYQPLLDIHLYMAVAAMNSGDKKTSAASFAELARLRPDYRIDPQQFPPAVLDAFEKARQAESRQARGRLVINAVPAGAKIYVDEVAAGTAPGTVAATPGEHVVRVEKSGYYSWAEKISVASYAKVDKEAVLKKNLGSQALRQLEAELMSGPSPQVLAKLGSTVTEALGAQGTIVGVVGGSYQTYAISVVYLPKSGAMRAVVGEVSRDMKDLPAVAEKLARALAVASKDPAAAAGSKTDVRILSPKPPLRPLDFAKYGTGMATGTLPVELIPKPTPEMAALDPRLFGPGGKAAVQQPGLPWWAWTGGAAVVAGAAGGAAYFFLKPPPPVTFDLHRNQAR
jgi:PEGA domain-containing protein